MTDDDGQVPLEDRVRAKLGEDLGAWDVVADDVSGSFTARLHEQVPSAEAADHVQRAWVRLQAYSGSHSLVEARDSDGEYHRKLL